MAYWKRKNELASREKADKVARYYYAYYNFMGYRPTLDAVANRFNRSQSWARNYLILARDLDFVRKEWDVRIPRACWALEPEAINGFHGE